MLNDSTDLQWSVDWDLMNSHVREKLCIRLQDFVNASNFYLCRCLCWVFVSHSLVLEEHIYVVQGYSFSIFYSMRGWSEHMPNMPYTYITPVQTYIRSHSIQEKSTVEVIVVQADNQETWISDEEIQLDPAGCSFRRC